MCPAAIAGSESVTPSRTGELSPFLHRVRLSPLGRLVPAEQISDLPAEARKRLVVQRVRL
jgi:hypothetical protein